MTPAGTAGGPAAPGQIAADQFRRRQAILRRDLAEQRIALTQAEAKLAPWLAIAAMAGAQLDELYENTEIVAPAARAGEPVRIRLQSTDICSRGDALAALARARDAAIDRVPDPADPTFAQLSEAAHQLQVLAAFLGAAPYQPPQLKEAA